MANNSNSGLRSKRLWLIVAAIAAGVILFAAFISLRRADIPVRADRAVRGTIMSAISTNGKVEPLQSFEAHAPGPTTVKRIFVHEGDHVKRGQLLVQLDDADVRAKAAQAEAQLRAAQADLHAVEAGGTHEEVLTNQSQLVKARMERDAAKRNLDAMQRLEKKGAASPAEVQEAQSRLKRAQADLDLLNKKQNSRYSTTEIEKVKAQAEEARAALAAAQGLLSESNIRAAMDGTVYSLPVRENAYVNAGDLLVAVADLKTVQVRAFVDEPDIGRLSSGEIVDIHWDALPNRIWKGKLTRVPTNVSLLGSRNVGTITCAVDNSDLKLIPNVNVSVAVITAQHDNALTVPREAVHQENGQRYVYEIVNGELKRREVDTTISNLTRIEVVKGLSDNAQIALGALNSQELRDGLPVRVESR